MTWLTSLRDRPIAEGERRCALALLLALLLASTLTLLFTRPPARHGTPHRTSVSVTAIAVPRASGTARSTVPGASASLVVVAVSRVFLAGYLAYLYGHQPASQIQDATHALREALQTHPPRVSPAMREREARIVGLQMMPAPAGLLGVKALINDGGLVDYPIGLLLEHRDGRLLVSGLDGEG